MRSSVRLPVRRSAGPANRESLTTPSSALQAWRCFELDSDAANEVALSATCQACGLSFVLYRQHNGCEKTAILWPDVFSDGSQALPHAPTPVAAAPDSATLAEHELTIRPQPGR